MNQLDVLPAVQAFLSQPGRLFIGGTWQDAASGRRFAVENPATEETLTEVARSDERDVDAAVAAARAHSRGLGRSSHRPSAACCCFAWRTCSTSTAKNWRS